MFDLDDYAVSDHYRRASEVGIAHGRRVALLVMDDLLKPVRGRR